MSSAPNDTNVDRPKHTVGISATAISFIVLGIVIVVIVTAGLIWFFKKEDKAIKIRYE